MTTTITTIGITPLGILIIYMLLGHMTASAILAARIADGVRPDSVWRLTKAYFCCLLLWPGLQIIGSRLLLYHLGGQAPEKFKLVRHADGRVGVRCGMTGRIAEFGSAEGFARISCLKLSTGQDHVDDYEWSEDDGSWFKEGN